MTGILPTPNNPLSSLPVGSKRVKRGILDTVADRLLTKKYHILQAARNYLFIMLQLNGTHLHL